MKSKLAHAFLEKNLFTTYNFTPPRRQSSSPTQDEDVPLDELGNEEDEEDEDPTVSFGVSLSALLECLQIFGVTETKESRWGGSGRDGSVFSSVRDGGPAAAFDQHFLRVQGTCRLLYPSEGEPLSLMYVFKLRPSLYHRPAQKISNLVEWFCGNRDQSLTDEVT